MSRVVWRLRCRVTGGWKLSQVTGVWRPVDFRTREAAAAYAEDIRHYRIVKVTIRPRRNKEREAVVAYLRAQRDASWSGSNVAFWAQKFADDIEAGEHLK